MPWLKVSLNESYVVTCAEWDWNWDLDGMVGCR